VRVCALAVLAMAVYVPLFGRTAFTPRVFNLDFVAFYCAGETANGGADPYLTEPLRSCEHRVGASFRRGSVLVLPAPLPAYDIALFRAIALAPFAAASLLWLAAGVAATVGCMLLLARLTGCGGPFALAALLVSLGWTSLFLGQLVPICLCGILLALAGERAQRPWLVVAGTLGAAIEPHLGAVALLALAVAGSARTRFAVVAGAGILLIVSFAALPLERSIEYAARVLPAHAASEIDNREQFGLAHQLHLLGLGVEGATRLAEFVYLAVLVASLLATRRLAARWGATFAVLAVAATCLVVEPFLHITQIPVAAAAAAAGYGATRSRAFAWAALCLAIPWIDFAPIVVVGPLCAGIAVFFARRAGARLITGAVLGVATIVCAYAAGLAVSAAPRHLITATAARPGDLAEVSWREAVELADVGLPWLFVTAELPTYAGLALTIAGVWTARPAGAARPAATPSAA
jgi:hypothetical protein